MERTPGAGGKPLSNLIAAFERFARALTRMIAARRNARIALGAARRRFAQQAGSAALLSGLAAGCASGGYDTGAPAPPPAPSPPPPPAPPPPQPPAPPPPPPEPAPSEPDRGEEWSGDGRPLPRFPWFPPTPTDFAVLPRIYFASARNQWEVDRILSRALREAGYRRRYSYYSVPNGFALVARIEQLRNNAQPEEERFGLADESTPGLIGAVVGVLFPRVGYYRQVVFLVTDQPWRPTSGPLPPPLTAIQAEQMLRNGAPELPEAYREMPFSSGYRVTSLIYEFVNRQSGERTRASASNDKRHSAREHLTASGILRRLED